MTPDRIREVALDAFWRLPENRKSHWQALTCLPQRSPLVGVPFFDLDILQLDWLHIMDLGVTQQFLGSTFKILCSKLPGASLEAQCRELHVRMKYFYRVNETASKLDVLKPTMLQAAGKPYPKLRAKAGEARALVLFSLELTRDLLSNEDVFEHTLKLCAKVLNETYAQLSHDVFHPPTFSSKAREFALLYVALADHAQAQEKCLFHITGKFYLFMEMASFMNSRNPSDVWTYRDESFGGEISSLACRRGGSSNPHAVGMSFFQRFMANNNVPSL